MLPIRHGMKSPGSRHDCPSVFESGSNHGSICRWNGL
jgi:hypothetical protein